jgi:hypothetical protein
VGFAIFVLAFFLPAVTISAGDKPMYGWRCAWITLIYMIDPHSYTSAIFLAVMSGLINPLILAYFFCGLRKKSMAARPYITVAIMACIAATWIFVRSSTLHLGIVMWNPGTLLMLAPDIAAWKLASGMQADRR